MGYGYGPKFEIHLVTEVVYGRYLGLKGAAM